MGKLILILGGARSGKSSYAESLARRMGGDQVLFVATAEAYDDEMRRRIKAHQSSRPSAWRTLEETIAVAPALEASWAGERIVLLDCVTLWVSNLLLALGDDPPEDEVSSQIQRRIGELIAWIESGERTVIAVSNEVGMGVVPPYKLGRLYRDELGRANQLLAQRADQVILMVAGIPVVVKTPADQ